MTDKKEQEEINLMNNCVCVGVDAERQRILKIIDVELNKCWDMLNDKTLALWEQDREYWGKEKLEALKKQIEVGKA